MGEIGPHTKARVRDDVTWRDFGDEAVVLNLESGVFYGLNPTAARALQLLGDGATVGATVEALALEFAASPRQLQADVCGLCADLSARGIVDLS